MKLRGNLLFYVSQSANKLSLEHSISPLGVNALSSLVRLVTESTDVIRMNIRRWTIWNWLAQNLLEHNQIWLKSEQLQGVKREQSEKKYSAAAKTVTGEHKKKHKKKHKFLANRMKQSIRWNRDCQLIGFDSNVLNNYKLMNILTSYSAQKKKYIHSVLHLLHTNRFAVVRVFFSFFFIIIFFFCFFISCFISIRFSFISILMVSILSKKFFFIVISLLVFNALDGSICTICIGLILTGIGIDWLWLARLRKYLIPYQIWRKRHRVKLGFDCCSFFVLCASTLLKISINIANKQTKKESCRSIRL